jgi:hypothetical protein
VGAIDPEERARYGFGIRSVKGLFFGMLDIYVGQKVDAVDGVKAERPLAEDAGADREPLRFQVEEIDVPAFAILEPDDFVRVGGLSIYIEKNVERGTPGDCFVIDLDMLVSEVEITGMASVERLDDASGGE